MIKLIVGLGNPGTQYETTRHNIGFLAVDHIGEKAGIRVSKIKFKGLYGEGRIAGKKVLLLKPQTYMNLSGESAREICKYYGIAPEEMLVIVDDVDIEFGDVRIRKSGSAGTHNGLKSLIYQLESDDFPRIKIGVGRKPPGWDLADHVLSRFPSHQRPIMEQALERVWDIVETALEHDLDYAMNQYNKKPLPGLES